MRFQRVRRAARFRGRAVGVAASAATALVPVAATAGAWLQPPGAYYAKLSMSYLYTDTEYDDEGDEVPILSDDPLVRAAAFREIALGAYVEYGFSRRSTLVGMLPFKILTSRRTELSEGADLIREVDVTNAGLSDLWLGVRYGLATGRFPVSVQGMVKAPLGYRRAPKNDGPALGSARADAEAGLLFGASMRSVYASAWASYRVRGGDLADEGAFGVEVGASRARVFAQIGVEARYATRDPKPLDRSATVVVVDQDVVKLSASAGWRIDARTAIAIEGYHAAAGENTATGTTLALALVLQR